MLKSLLIMLFNFKERFYHHSSFSEITLIKNTHFFIHMNEADFNKMIRSIRATRYAENTLIFREGEVGNSLFIIAEGSVRVFTYDAHGKKIALARLNKGNYFGEQALLGQANKTRNANIETITDTTIIQIDEKFISHLLQTDTELKTKLKKTGYKQALNILSLSTDFYNNIQDLASKIENPNVIEFDQDELIFNVGDKPDNAYIILQGQVKINILDNTTNKFSTIFLHKGSLFGELSILQNKSRAGTAIAQGKVRLLVISADLLRDYLSKNPQLKDVFSKLQQIYQLPMRGTVEQYSGNKGKENTITNIYKMDDGRSITASRFLNEDIFTMQTVNQEGSTLRKYEKHQNKVKLNVTNNQIIGITVCGFYDNLPNLCRALLDKETIDDNTLNLFEQTGEFKTQFHSQGKDDEIICQCQSVTRKQLQEQIDKGITDLDSLSKITGACTSCKGCSSKILQLLGINPWLSAVMKKLIMHNSYINSYLITPIHEHFKSFQAGQHIIVQVKIGNNWVERPYTISDRQQDGSLRITTKKEPGGLFTSWLFQQEEFHLNVTQPQGNFFLNPDDTFASLCFAGGIGITPFITFAKTLLNNPNKRIHILYCALTTNDFVFTEEFNELTKQLPNLTVTYRSTETSNLLTENDIINLVKEFSEPDVYICGPAGFTKLIQNTLEKMPYPANKIHTEKFVHAGV